MKSKKFLFILGTLLSVIIFCGFIIRISKSQIELEGSGGLSSKEKVKIIYVFDPLCGWCYGFEPVMKSFQEKYKDTYEFEVVAGGMVPKGGPPLSNMREYLIKAIPYLEKKTGVKISQAYRDNILMKDGVYLDSELPTKVFLFLKPKYKGKEAELAQQIQDLLYQKGLNTNKIDTYNQLKGFDKKKFEAQDLSSTMKADFARSKQLQVKGFPAVFMEKDGNVIPVSSGYVSLKELEKRVGM